MEAIDAENMGVKSSSQTDVLEPSFENVEGTVIVKFTPNDNKQEMGYSEKGHEEVRRDRESSKLQSHSRKFVDFSHAQKNEASIKIAKKARKRAQVSMITCICLYHTVKPPVVERDTVYYDFMLDFCMYSNSAKCAVYDYIAKVVSPHHGVYIHVFVHVVIP